MNVVFLFIALLGLWLGTELIIKGALNIANYYNLSQMFIGLSVLAIGTDLPEMVISISGSIQHLKGTQTSGVIVGNALGSCFAQVSIVLGISGLAGYLTLTKKHLKYDGIVLLGSIALLFLFALDGIISRIEGISLLIVYTIYYLSLFHNENFASKIKTTKSDKRIWQDLFFLISGALVVIFCADRVVHHAVILAESWGVKQSFIGIILIGLGTSLPELAISINAALKKASGLSVGNLIGSNIFDLLMPIGAGATIIPLSFDKNLNLIDLPLLFALTILLLFFFKKRKGLQRNEAISLITIYIGYIIFKLSEIAF
ncbi:sodium:calcium antiporter [Fulvivirgaceae bacterium BMA10]|uniref:Sodium:calcium antiporter n=1 Tax=Splendidivirga corallicola TaxID=3051826 RepID=A0ABT8KU81_9BACT|nr:sodium:calcium antiporter [Fulvivirgaceae bacterium BMA10]